MKSDTYRHWSNTMNKDASTIKISTHARQVKRSGSIIPVTLVRIDVLDITGAFEYRFESLDPVAIRMKLEELGYGFML